MSFSEGLAPQPAEPSPEASGSDCGSCESEIYKFSLAIHATEISSILLTPERLAGEESVGTAKPGPVLPVRDDSSDYRNMSSREISDTTTPPTLVMPLGKTGKQKREEMRMRCLLLRPIIKAIEERFYRAKRLGIPIDHKTAGIGVPDGVNGVEGLRELDLEAKIESRSESGDQYSIKENGRSVSAPKSDASSDKESVVSHPSPISPGQQLSTSTIDSVGGESSIPNKIQPSLEQVEKTEEDAETGIDFSKRNIDTTNEVPIFAPVIKSEAALTIVSQATHDKVDEGLTQPGTSVTLGPDVGHAASLGPENKKGPIPIPVPPHLRRLNTIKSMPLLEKRAMVLPQKTHMPGTPISTPTRAVSCAGVQKGPPDVSSPPAPKNVNGAGFKIPENPHFGGYDLRAVLKDPAQKVDVRGLKFTAWPEAVNRGNRIAQEARAVIIDVPITPTLSIITLMCKDTGKIESIFIDPAKSKAMVTFTEVKDADQFWRRAMKPLDFISTDDENGVISKQQIMVRMDWPVDQLQHSIRERIWTHGASRMVLLGGWEKKNLERVVGKVGEVDSTMETLLKRLAEHYVPGGVQGRVEKVTFKEKGWGFFEGTILYGGILEAMAAFDGLKVELEFKGCDIKFGIDPCEPPVTTHW